MWGQSQYNPASQFVSEVPAELIDWKREGASVPAWTGGSIGGPRFSGSYWGAGGSSAAGSAPVSSPAKAIGRVQPQKEVVSVAPGDKVNHTTFGHGTVLAVEGAGDKTVAKVRFGEGEKRLLLRYAPLTKAG
jgi:DNA helicase-2/ATP-dependent DNA helicase PcrA